MEYAASNVSLHMPQQDLLASLGIASRGMGGGVSTVSEDNAFLAVIQQMISQILSGEAAEGSQSGENMADFQSKQDETSDILAQYMQGLLFLQPNAECSATGQGLESQDSLSTPQVSLDAMHALEETLQLGLLQKEQNQVPGDSAIIGMELKAQRSPGSEQANHLTDAGRDFSLSIEEGREAETQALPTGTKSAGTEEVSTLNLQSRFQSAVEEARKQIGTQKPGAEQAVDVDKIQNELNTQRPSAYETASVMLDNPAEAPDVTRQLTEGIKSNFMAGKREFVVKLRPETLGEITVKLVDKGGKLALSILTANAQTARMINSDLSTLREAVRPMQVQIQEVVAQDQPPADAQMTQFNFYGQQFAQQRQQQAFYSQSNGTHPSLPRLDETEENEVSKMTAIENAVLDTYI